MINFHFLFVLFLQSPTSCVYVIVYGKSCTPRFTYRCIIILGVLHIIRPTTVRGAGGRSDGEGRASRTADRPTAGPSPPPPPRDSVVVGTGGDGAGKALIRPASVRVPRRELRVFVVHRENGRGGKCRRCLRLHARLHPRARSLVGMTRRLEPAPPL